MTYTHPASPSNTPNPPHPAKTSSIPTTATTTTILTIHFKHPPNKPNQTNPIRSKSKSKTTTTKPEKTPITQIHPPHITMPQILTWALFGAAVRWWQLGIETRPFLALDTAWGYPAFAAVGGSFGYWLSQVDKRQTEILARRRVSLLEKRRRAREREEATGGGGISAVAAGV